MGDFSEKKDALQTKKWCELIKYVLLTMLINNCG